VRIELGKRLFHALIRRLTNSPTPICYLLFAIRAWLRLITHEKQSNPGHHACEEHDRENEEKISQGVIGQHGSEYSSRHVKQPTKREEEQKMYRMLV
jgi:hypothetical protein